MHQDKAIGMFMGLFIGDALGAPLEFIRPHEMTHTLTEMEGGGVHNTAEGEWTDDGAMAVAIADAYIGSKRFDPEAIAMNFKMWKKTGHFGTRNYVFDIGRTCSESIDRITPTHPYAGSCSYSSSGNGSIMRVAPVVLANHNCMPSAVAQGVAVSLMTHGNADTVHYIAGFVAELMSGKAGIVAEKNSLFKYFPNRTACTCKLSSHKTRRLCRQLVSQLLDGRAWQDTSRSYSVYRMK
jgi:ADP-ribosyl-[dinitrogen reductase] hydrolase